MKREHLGQGYAREAAHRLGIAHANGERGKHDQGGLGILVIPPRQKADLFNGSFQLLPGGRGASVERCFDRPRSWSRSLSHGLIVAGRIPSASSRSDRGCPASIGEREWAWR